MGRAQQITDGEEVVGDNTEERRRRAIAAAKAVSATWGIRVDETIILQDSNHTVLHLAPVPLVAKVDTSPEERSLGDELRVARFLAERTGLVVPPTGLFPPGPYTVDGLEVTFWEYCPHASAEPSPAALSQSLRSLHDAFSGYPEPLRPWDRFNGIGRVLSDLATLSALPPNDRAFLRRMYAELVLSIGSFHPEVRPLHGAPHAGNLLLSPRGPRWIDFESACIGPREWDLTVLPDNVVVQSFEHVDWDLLAILRKMRSLCVATWCWLDPDRAPVLREAGAYHLSLLKAAR